MGGNKHNTQFAIHKPDIYQLVYKDLYNEKCIMTETPKQIINHILKQQLK